MIQCVSILGSTGSIGRQTLDIIDHLNIRVAALSAGTNVSRMAEQCKKYQPVLAVMSPREAADKLAAYIKCVEEQKAGNLEFESAARQTLESMHAMERPELNWFIAECLPAFALNLDELGIM